MNFQNGDLKINIPKYLNFSTKQATMPWRVQKQMGRIS
jgi:hypothetical protein